VIWSIGKAVDLLEPWFLAQHYAREAARDDPRLAMVPLELSEKSLATLNGVHIGFHGFALQTPWTRISKQMQGKQYLAVLFENGAEVTFFDPPATPAEAKLLARDPQMVAILSAETVESDYALTAASLTATPAQVGWLRTPKRNARALFLLETKSMMLRDSGQIYKLGLGEMRGFQTGNPMIAPYTVFLDLFDRSDRRYQIRISANAAGGPVLTQAQLNAVVTSFKPASND
jgi:hypothetical protein